MAARKPHNNACGTWISKSPRLSTRPKPPLMMSCMSKNRLIRWPASSTALVATVSRPWPTKRIRRLRRLSRFRSMNTTSTSAIARLPSDSITGLSKPDNRDSQGGLSASTTTVGGFSGTPAAGGSTAPPSVLAGCDFHSRVMSWIIFSRRSTTDP